MTPSEVAVVRPLIETAQDDIQQLRSCIEAHSTTNAELADVYRRMELGNWPGPGISGDEGAGSGGLSVFAYPASCCRWRRSASRVAERFKECGLKAHGSAIRFWRSIRS